MSYKTLMDVEIDYKKPKVECLMLRRACGRFDSQNILTKDNAVYIEPKEDWEE